MTLGAFIEARPMLFHTAALANLAAVKETGVLMSTESLLRGTAYEHLLSARRADSAVVDVRGQRIVVRDQRPLRLGSLSLEDMTIEEWIAELNRRVFFWPGAVGGPIAQGRRHFDLYARADEVFVLRTSVRALIDANPGLTPFVSMCNSGSARHQQGRPVTRGRRTYRELESAQVNPYEVVEVSFLDRVHLPKTVEFARDLSGPWCRLRK